MRLDDEGALDHDDALLHALTATPKAADPQADACQFRRPQGVRHKRALQQFGDFDRSG